MEGVPSPGGPTRTSSTPIRVRLAGERSEVTLEPQWEDVFVGQVLRAPAERTALGVGMRPPSSAEQIWCFADLSFGEQVGEVDPTLDETSTGEIPTLAVRHAQDEEGAGRRQWVEGALGPLGSEGVGQEERSIARADDGHPGRAGLLSVAPQPRQGARCQPGIPAGRRSGWGASEVITDIEGRPAL